MKKLYYESLYQKLINNGYSKRDADLYLLKVLSSTTHTTSYYKNTHKGIMGKVIAITDMIRNFFAKIFRIVAVLTFVFFIIMAVFVYLAKKNNSSVSENIAQNHTQTEKVEAKKYNPPQKTPLGTEWPMISSHMSGYPIKNLGGLSSISINNTKNDSDVFVVLLDSAKQPIRHIFIKNYDSYKISNIKKGKYYLLFQYLKHGSFQISELIDIQEIKSSSSIKYSDLRISMAKVKGGNFRTNDINADEFYKFIN